MIAIRHGHSEMVDKLLDKGANIEAANKVNGSDYNDRIYYYYDSKYLTMCLRTLFDID